MARTRIILADDHPLILAGLKALLQDDPTVEVIGHASDGQSALRLAAELNPDVIVLDLSMPGINGVRVAQLLRAQCPTCHVLILSVHEDRAYLRRLLELGVSGYVLKRSAPEQLITAIRAVAAGGVYLDPEIAGMVIGRELNPKSARILGHAAELSSRETAVLRLAAAGYSNKELSSRLQIGVKTIETYKTRAMEKLGFETRAELVRYAMAKGWLDEL
jgi:DNA-binding NarL/FixJ family response regulator